MKFETNISDVDMACNIITAIEQGIHYWARNVGAEEYIPDEAKAAAEADGCLPAWAFAPLFERGFMSIDEYDETVRPDPDDPTVGLIERHTLNLDKLRRGIKRLLKNQPQAASRILCGEGDANDADLLFQWALFGELRYA